MRRAAIFDVDGTIVKGSSEKVFVRYLLEKRELEIGKLLSIIPASLTGNPLRTMKRNKLYLKDMDVRRVQELALQCFKGRILPLVSPLMKEVIESHRVRGDLVILLTGSLDFLTKPLMAYLGADVSVATRVESRDGYFTGMINGIHPCGRDKLRILKEVSKEQGIDLGCSYAYGNSFGDREVLNAVGYPVAVNPDPLLWFLAKRRGWKVLYS